LVESQLADGATRLKVGALHLFKSVRSLVDIPGLENRSFKDNFVRAILKLSEKTDP
jgi:hypothetical protein